jgi:REP element-mobilizing transposase RayT
MATTLTRNLLHITFSTKQREPLISDAIEPHLHAYLGGICRRSESPALTIGGTSDHVHLLVSLSKSLALSDLMMELKRDSSKWVKDHPAGTRDFAWQEGYFAFSIGASGIDDLTAYVANQKAHHATIDFKDELRKFLRKYEVEFDERYVWS